MLKLATDNDVAWTVTPLVPGVASLQVLSGTGSNGVINQYVAGNGVTASTPVCAACLAFLIEVQLGSASVSNPASITLLGNVVNVPQNTCLRWIFEITVKLRNAARRPVVLVIYRLYEVADRGSP
ncbi:MAG: hypothetical protein ACJA2P_002537 [Rhodoferax sp.]